MYIIYFKVRFFIRLSYASLFKCPFSLFKNAFFSSLLNPCHRPWHFISNMIRSQVVPATLIYIFLSGADYYVILIWGIWRCTGFGYNRLRMVGRSSLLQLLRNPHGKNQFVKKLHNIKVGYVWLHIVRLLFFSRYIQGYARFCQIWNWTDEGEFFLSIRLLKLSSLNQLDRGKFILIGRSFWSAIYILKYKTIHSFHYLIH